MKKILAGRGAVDYYLNQTRRGLADYYLPDPGERTAGEVVGERLTAPGSRWWGGGTAVLGLSGAVEREQFVPLYGRGLRPGGGVLGRRFRTQEDAAEARKTARAAAEAIVDPNERWQARQKLARSGPQASVSAWDATFSPTKSVSLLWAAGDRNIQYQVWAAHLAAVDAGLGYLQDHAGFVRAGRNGIRVLESDGLVVARMNEWTSRDGDMHLHTHCVILNRAPTREDSKWRALDGRALLAAKAGASAIYHRVLEAELTRRLQVSWRDRPEGLRELDGVSDELIATFSTRRRAITSRLAELTAAYEARYGITPPPAIRYAMAQDATLETRRTKTDLAPDEALDAWERRARHQGTELAALPAAVIGRAEHHPQPAAASDSDALGKLLEHLSVSDRASFTRHDLLRAALDVLPIGTDTAAQLRARSEELVGRLLDTGLLIDLHAPDPLTVPERFRRADGTSIFTRHARQRWAVPATLDREAWLLKVAGEPAVRPVPADTIDHAIDVHQLGSDQATAVGDLLGAGQRIGLLVGPAGAGKTRTLRAVVDAWQQDGGHVLGLTVSQAAAEVLAAEAHVHAENTAKWLYETRRGRWQLPDRPLLLIDEASMVSTTDLVELVHHARHAGGKVLLVGDPAQLSAIHIGGAFDLLAERHGAAHLTEIRRFTDPWEARASLQLRDRNPAAISDYAMRDRIHGGRTEDIETALFDAWQADALGVDDHGNRQSVLMIVTTNDQAAILGERARTALIAAGHVTPGPTITLADNLASVGDDIVTRRNDRRLATTGGGWVVNGQTWTITAVNDDGSIQAARHGDHADIRLPADYLAAHTHLAYATTAHRAQGMTVDLCHATIDADTTHEQLYVAATRGRDGNHLWVALDTDRDLITDDTHLPEPHALIARALQRRDPDRLSAHQLADDSRTEIHSLARLGAIFEDTARHATDRWLGDQLAAHGLTDVPRDHEWASLLDRTRQLALAGHDLTPLLGRAIGMRPIGDAHSTAAVLHWRIGQLAKHTPPARTQGPIGSLPPVDSPHAEVARAAGELIRQRWHDIRTTLTDHDGTLDHARALGPRPPDPADARSWVTAATAITAYRERYDLPDHTPMLGDRPGPLRPDAQAAYDHAQQQIDRYGARQYRHHNPEQLHDLRVAAQQNLNGQVTFDPDELHAARRRDDAARRTWRSTTGTTRPAAKADHERVRTNTVTLEHLAADHHAARQQRELARNQLRHLPTVTRAETTSRRR